MFLEVIDFLLKQTSRKRSIPGIECLSQAFSHVIIKRDLYWFKWAEIFVLKIYCKQPLFVNGTKEESWIYKIIANAQDRISLELINLNYFEIQSSHIYYGSVLSSFKQGQIMSPAISTHVSSENPLREKALLGQTNFIMLVFCALNCCSLVARIERSSCWDCWYEGLPEPEG